MMKTLFDVSSFEKNNLAQAILSAFVKKGGELPDLYANTAEVAQIRKTLAEQYRGVKWRFYVAHVDPYAEMAKWLEKGTGFEHAKGGAAVRICGRVIWFCSAVFVRIVRFLSARSAKKDSILAKYDEFLTAGRSIPADITRTGIRIVSVLPDPVALKNPQKYFADKGMDWMRARFKNLTHDDVVIPASDTCKEDLLVYAPSLSAKNVIEVARPGATLEEWADGVVARKPASSRSDYVNNWHNNAPRTELERSLLVGDMAVMRIRHRVSTACNRPVDGFGTSLKIADPRFKAQLKTFLFSHPYKYTKVVFMVGGQLQMKPARDKAVLEELAKLAGCEAMLASPMPAHMQEKKYVGPVTPGMVNAQRDYIACLAAELGWRFVDVFQYVMEAEHTDGSIAFCTGRSHVGMSHSLRTARETTAQGIVDASTELMSKALELSKDEGPSQREEFNRLFKEGKIAPGEAKLEFEEWETLTVRADKHCTYLFVGGCLLRDCCAASVKLKSRPTAEVYASSHSIADPAYVDGLRCMTEGKEYDVAYFNFGAHFFLHTRDEYTAAFDEILSILKAHAKRVVLLTLPELVSTGEADRAECDFKNEKIRWANDQMLTVYSNDYTVVPVHQMVLKYAARRLDYFHFDRGVYDELFKEIQTMIGEAAE